MKIDKDIYVDVCGTLTRQSFINDGKGEFDELRTHAIEFLEFLVENFTHVYWLSTNREFGEFDLPVLLGRKDLSEKIKYIEFDKSKYDAIDYSRPFYFFDDEVEYDYYHEWGLLKDDIPLWKKKKYISKYNPKIHVMYYIAANAPMDVLKSVIEDIKIREKID